MDWPKQPGLAGFGLSGKNLPFWTCLNRPVQNLSIVHNCPKLSKKQNFTRFVQNLAQFFTLFMKNHHEIKISHIYVLKCYLSLSKTDDYFQYYSTCRRMTMNYVEVVQCYRHSNIDAVRSSLGQALCVSKTMSEAQH